MQCLACLLAHHFRSNMTLDCIRDLLHWPYSGFLQLCAMLLDLRYGCSSHGAMSGGLMKY